VACLEVVGIEEVLRRICRVLGSYFRSLVASRAREEKGKRRGKGGDFIVAAGALIWWESEWNL
jgi:hypothetical protein